MSDNDYMTMKELGTLFGMTSHQIGRLLKDSGLRAHDGKPTKVAFDEGYCGQCWTQDYKYYCWAWHPGKITRILAEQGLKPLAKVTRKEC